MTQLAFVNVHSLIHACIARGLSFSTPVSSVTLSLRGVAHKSQAGVLQRMRLYSVEKDLVSNPSQQRTYTQA